MKIYNSKMIIDFKDWANLINTYNQQKLYLPRENIILYFILLT